MMIMLLSASKPFILIASLFTAFLLLTFPPASQCAACTETEKQALLTFQHSLQDPSNKLSSWGDGKVNCCQWKGVICSSLTGHVEGLQLQSGLNGTLSSSLLDLKHLRYLDLSQNNFHQPIPSFIGSLASLEYLNLSHAEFYGKIPYSIGNLSKLHTLSLEETRSTPSPLQVDSLEWLWGLSNLKHLNLNGLNLSQARDWEKQVIHKLPSLIHLHLSSCILSDSARLSNDVNISRSNLGTLDLSSNSFATIPEWIFQLTNLNFLDLSVNSFEGPIPTNANFTRLQHINLSENHFNSTIPDWLYTCENLEFVDFGSNNLQGNISSAIANLTSLATLVLSHNELSGEIPREIGRLCKMQRLDLSYNKLGGDISDSSFAKCKGSLEFLDLSVNQLSGHLTHLFWTFKQLRALMLGRNSLSGVIPSNIGNLSSLQSLDMSYNRLSGNLPESVGQLFNLKGLLLHFNMLEGVVTEAHFARLSKLTVLSASGNHLTLNISNPDWIPPFKLETLLLGLWSLGSDSRIFSWLGTQQNSILELDLSSTGISSDVPSWLWSVKYLNLSYNQLHGKIPVISDPKVDDVSYGRFIYLSSNNFSGPLPRVGNKVAELDLSNNSFSGGISHFLCQTSTQYLARILDLGGNRLSGELPDCWMTWPVLQVLNLGNNNFSGRIPNSIGSLVYLVSLNLNDNKLSGHIPFSIDNCSKLLKLDFARNNLDGSMGTWSWTSLSGLKYLILRSNNFHGELNPSICQLNSLQILDLSNNRFSGVIPSCVDSFTAMTTTRSLPEGKFDYGAPGYSFYYGETGYSLHPRAFIESASINIKGNELHYDTILPLVTGIDLSRNNFSGDIPSEITSLVELKSLNLSGNNFTGIIPDNIGNMKQLESLDLSRNFLSGEIPNSFTLMTSLEYVNLSSNNLSGRIPESTQLWGFNESSFDGNNLCGPPLTVSCTEEGEVVREAGEEREKREIEWYYVCLSLGYAVGLSLVVTAFMLKKAREAYYGFLQDTWDNVYVFFCIKWRSLTRALGQD